jgi:hypothetical protein
MNHRLRAHPAAMPPGWRKSAIGACVLVLHALLILALVRTASWAPAMEIAHETQITLTPIAPLPKPIEKKKHTPVTAAAPHAIATTLSRPLAHAPTPDSPDTTLQGLGASLGCSASNYDSLHPEQRAACGRGPWAYDALSRETAALIIKAPHVMSAADRAWRIRSTTDPCAAEKLTHQTDCIYTIIYGNKLP